MSQKHSEIKQDLPSSLYIKEAINVYILPTSVRHQYFGVESWFL